MATSTPTGLQNERTATAAIVSAALRVLRCGAVVVTSAGGEIMDAAGEVDRGSAPLREWLTALESDHRDDGGPVEVEQDTATRLGFRAVSTAPVRIDNTRLGTIYGLSHRNCAVDEGLLRAFASHYAVALARSPLSPAGTFPTRGPSTTETTDQLVPSVSGFRELVTQINSLLAVMFGDVRCGVMAWDQERHVLQMVAGSFGASSAITASYQVNPGDLRSNAARVFELLSPYLTNHAVGDPALLQSYVAAFEIERLLSVPLWVGDRVVGVLHVADKASEFTIADLEECERVGPNIALAVEMTWMLLRERRQQQFEATLSRVAQAVADGSATVRLLRGNLSELRKTVGASAIVLAPDTGSPIIVTASGSELAGQFDLVIEEARSLQGERAHVVQPRGPGDPGSAAFHVPIRLGVRQLGTLSALRDHGERFDSDERLALARMANLASMSWASEAVARHQALLTRLEERQRIADDLHDDVAQLLFAANLQLDTALATPDIEPQFVERVSRARVLISRGDNAIRNLIHQLSRPTPTSLPEQLDELAERIKDEFQMVVRVEISPEGRSYAARARASVNEVLLRVATESLVNAGKHAGPCRCSLRLEGHDEQIMVIIVDDGIGVDKGDEVHHYGIASLRATARRRGGSINVRRGRVGGTVISASFPL
jgi:signal transduction histidine kinase